MTKGLYTLLHTNVQFSVYIICSFFDLKEYICSYLSRINSMCICLWTYSRTSLSILSPTPKQANSESNKKLFLKYVC